jgi:hypothetical protein
MSTPALEPSPIETRPRQVEFTRRFVQPPGALYIDPDDRLYAEFSSRYTDTPFSISLRLLLPGSDGVIVNHHIGLRTNPVIYDRSTEVNPLSEGFLLGVAVASEQTPLVFGDLYIAVALVRGEGIRKNLTQVLCAGYVDSVSGPSWPAGPLRGPGDGPGRIFRAGIGNPAAGAELDFILTGSREWRLLNVRIPFTTGAAVANRRVSLELVDDGGDVILRAMAPDTQPAATTRVYNFAPWGFDAAVRDGETMAALPLDTPVRTFFRLRTNTVNLQGADEYDQSQAFVREWLAGS